MMIINFRFYLQRTMRVTLATTPIFWPLSDQGHGGEEEEEEGGSPPLKMEEGTRRFSAPTVKGNQVRKCFNFLIQWIQLHSKARKVKVTRLFKSIKGFWSTLLFTKKQIRPEIENWEYAETGPFNIYRYTFFGSNVLH